MVHPAPRMTSAPAPKTAVYQASVTGLAWDAYAAMDKAHAPGQNKSQVPIGLSTRASDR